MVRAILVKDLGNILSPLLNHLRFSEGLLLVLPHLSRLNALNAESNKVLSEFLFSLQLSVLALQYRFALELVLRELIAGIELVFEFGIFHVQGLSVLFKVLDRFLNEIILVV